MDTICPQFFFISTILSTLSFIKHNNALTVCPTAQWSQNATTFAQYGPIPDGPDYFTYRFRPRDVLITNNDYIYILLNGNLTVQLWLPNATSDMTILSGSLGYELNQFQTMDQMRMDINRSIYILDSELHRVTKWTSYATTAVLVAGGNGPGSDINQLSSPYGIYVESRTAIIWIADTSNDRIVKWFSPTNSTIVCNSSGRGPHQLSQPNGVFIDENDGKTMYVADTSNNRIQRWLFGATNGSTVAGNATGRWGNDAYSLELPSSVIVDTNKYMFIVDQFNHRIVRWQIGASYGETIAGTNGMGSLPNQLSYPNGIAFDSAGSLFVADSANKRIQKFSVLCNLTTTTVTTTTTTTSVTSTSTTSTLLTTTTTTTTMKSSALNLIVDVLFYQILFFMLLVNWLISNG